MLTPSSERSSEGDETEQTPNLQVHSFRWIQFEDNIKRSYQQLREKKMFFDVTISCENSQVEAHKIVLATNSDFFSRLLERSSFQNNPHPIIFIKDVEMKQLMFILEFMYTGEVKVPKNYATYVLQAAKVLEVKGFQTDDANDLNPFDTENRKRQFPSSSTLSFPIKRSHSDTSFNPILSTSKGSSPISLQHKIKLEENSFLENKKKGNAEDDDKQEKDKENTGMQENADDQKQQEDQENSKNDRLENVIQSIVEKTVSTSSPSDMKISRESQRAALVEKLGSRLFKCKQCEYTSNTAFNVKKHAEGHLSPREYKCYLCPSVVKNEVYFKDHMKAKHDIKWKF